jgi:hypothetical protein
MPAAIHVRREIGKRCPSTQISPTLDLIDSRTIRPDTPWLQPALPAWPGPGSKEHVPLSGGSEVDGKRPPHRLRQLATRAQRRPPVYMPRTRTTQPPRRPLASSARPFQCPQSDSNRHCADFKSAASANWAMGASQFRRRPHPIAVPSTRAAYISPQLEDDGVAVVIAGGFGVGVVLIVHGDVADERRLAGE